MTLMLVFQLYGLHTIHMTEKSEAVFVLKMGSNREFGAGGGGVARPHSRCPVFHRAPLVPQRCASHQNSTRERAESDISQSLWDVREGGTESDISQSLYDAREEAREAACRFLLCWRLWQLFLGPGDAHFLASFRHCLRLRLHLSLCSLHW